MKRDDITKYLVHWVKGENYEEAFQVFRQIVFQRRLIGSGNSIRGAWPCVCFTEAPEGFFIKSLGNINPSESKYQKLGFSKTAGGQLYTKLLKNMIYCQNK